MKCSKIKIPPVIKDNFRFGTLSFLFIIAYVNLFQYIFGPENSIVGVIFAIHMSASMVRDLTATPVKHTLAQLAVFAWMTLAAYWVTVLPAFPSVCINFLTIFLILYAFTYEYSDHMYFPYILSYLFLVFLSPVDSHQLPKRLLGMLFGVISIILYQWFMGRKRVVETSTDVFSEMIDELCLSISCRLTSSADQPQLAKVRRKLCQLSRTVYEQRKKVLCVSDASFAVLAAARGLEQLFVLIQKLPQTETLSDSEKAFLSCIDAELKIFRSFVRGEITQLPSLRLPDSSAEMENPHRKELYDAVLYIYDQLLHMTDPQRIERRRKTSQSLKIRLLAALDVSPVRVAYAVRTALLLSCATWIVQVLSLPHGKWLLFTLASVSLPYADDIPAKAKKRIIATLTGGIVSVLIYSLVPSPTGRTAAMMLSGYLSFYFSDYKEVFACSTVGALGGAVFLDTFGFPSVFTIFLIRLGYILLGVAAAYVLNCLVFPYSREKATRQLWKKFNAVTELLSKICQNEQTDPQLYYHLVIQAHLLEEKLTQNAYLEEWPEFPELLAPYQQQIRKAHRIHQTATTV